MHTTRAPLDSSSALGFGKHLIERLARVAVGESATRHIDADNDGVFCRDACQKKKCSAIRRPDLHNGFGSFVLKDAKQPFDLGFDLARAKRAVAG